MFDVNLDAVLTAKASLLADDPRRGPVQSGIAKQVVSAPVQVGLEGLAGDEQADRENHGGVDKAFMQYAFDHYPFWREQLGDHPLLQHRGAFGENLTTSGVTEADVCIGDTVSVGSAVFQISQGRQPCWKLNLRFEVPGMSRMVQKSLRTGWYYRVLEPGAIEAGDRVRLLDRVQPVWTVERALRLMFRTLPGEPSEVRAWSAELADVPELSASWRRTLIERLDKAPLKDASARLDG